MTASVDTQHMALALQLAGHGLFSTCPNPRVGCVLVRDGQVVGAGFHHRAGEPHAEVHALQQAGARASGATAYVSLEPCSHVGRTPPCASALINAKVARVVIAVEDPNPQVAGSGVRALREAGIDVVLGVMEESARAMNAGFFSRHARGRPFIRIKTGMSLDGRTAMASGESQWITGEPARRDVQRLRARSDAIITGKGTVMADNPSLNIREGELPLLQHEVAPARQPLRVILDRGLEIDPAARIFQVPGKVLWLGAASRAQSGSGIPAGLDSRHEVRLLHDTAESAYLDEVVRVLVEHQCNEVLVEAGAKVTGAFLQAQLVDEVVIYMAPNILGAGARGAFDLPGLDKLAQRIRLEIQDVRAVGRDLRITALPVEVI